VRTPYRVYCWARRRQLAGAERPTLPRHGRQKG
jgi:hypothetical protein